jgi:ATP-binding cassette subfamily F protein 3
VRNILGCFLFRGDDVFKKVGILSGGERSRVALVCMLIQPANFLILDEPTNHLDVQSQAVLQSALAEYPGAYLIVSHNRSFLDPIVAKTLEFRPGEPPQMYHGNVTYYLDKKAAEKVANKEPIIHNSQAQLSKLSDSSLPDKTKQPKLSRKEQRKLDAEKRQKRNTILKPLQEEFKGIEEKINVLETEKLMLTNEMSSQEVIADTEKSQITSQKYDRISMKLDNAISRWSKISEEIEQLEASL